MVVKKNKKDFVWKATRISFYTCIGLTSILFSWIIVFFAFEIKTDVPAIIIILLILVALIFNIITSIIHLTKYKEKSFPITSLILSSLFLLSMLIPMFSPFFTKIGFECGVIIVDLNSNSPFNEYDVIGKEIQSINGKKIQSIQDIVNFSNSVRTDSESKFLIGGKEYIVKPYLDNENKYNFGYYLKKKICLE